MGFAQRQHRLLLDPIFVVSLRGKTRGIRIVGGRVTDWDVTMGDYFVSCPVIGQTRAWHRGGVLYSAWLVRRSSLWFGLVWVELGWGGALFKIVWLKRALSRA